MITFLIIGNLGRDPIAMRETSNGSRVTTFSVASNRKFPRGDEIVKETTWVNVSVWNKLGDACVKYLSKGNKVAVAGRFVIDAETGSPRIWEGDDGVHRTGFEVSASQVEFLDKAPQNDPPPLPEGDDIPF